MTNTTTAAQPLDLDKLEALARAATPGPWFAQAVVGYRGNLFDVRAQYQRPIAGSIHDPNDATYIAGANPATVLQLIALARRAPAPADERALYEAWCIRKGYNTNKWHDGGYVDSNTQNGWEVWQARAAHQAAPAEESTNFGGEATS
jgi:hypothetical protein